MLYLGSRAVAAAIHGELHHLLQVGDGEPLWMFIQASLQLLDAIDAQLSKPLMDTHVDLLDLCPVASDQIQKRGIILQDRDPGRTVARNHRALVRTPPFREEPSEKVVRVSKPSNRWSGFLQNAIGKDGKQTKINLFQLTTYRGLQRSSQSAQEFIQGKHQ